MVHAEMHARAGPGAPLGGGGGSTAARGWHRRPEIQIPIEMDARRPPHGAIVMICHIKKTICHEQIGN